MKTENKEKKQLKELTDEELEQVTGGATHALLISVGGDYTCPDGSKVRSANDCIETML